MQLPETTLKNILEKVIQVARPVKIILFGSGASGTMGPNSDIDLLVVVPPGTHRRQTAQKIYQSLMGTGFATDAIVVTEDDLKVYADHPGMVIRLALKEGKIVYAS